MSNNDKDGNKLSADMKQQIRKLASLSARSPSRKYTPTTPNTRNFPNFSGGGGGGGGGRTGTGGGVNRTNKNNNFPNQPPPPQQQNQQQQNQNQQQQQPQVDNINTNDGFEPPESPNFDPNLLQQQQQQMNNNNNNNNSSVLIASAVDGGSNNNNDMNNNNSSSNNTNNNNDDDENDDSPGQGQQQQQQQQQQQFQQPSYHQRYSNQNQNQNFQQPFQQQQQQSQRGLAKRRQRLSGNNSNNNNQNNNQSGDNNNSGNNNVNNNNVPFNSASNSRNSNNNNNNSKQQQQQQQSGSMLMSSGIGGGGVIPTTTLDDLGGLEKELPIFRELVELPLRFPHLFSRLGADPPCGVLIHGQPGVGKTALVKALAGTFKVPLYAVSAPEIVQGVAGDSEALLRALFTEATANSPSIVFIDEIDTIAGRRDSAQREMEKRIVAQLLTCMDQLSTTWREQRKVVTVIGATNRPEAIDTALRRAGRFDREIPLGIPTTDERVDILKVITKGLSLSPDVDLHRVATSTPGYVGADLQLLIKEAGVLAIRRKYRELEQVNELDDIQSPRLNSFSIEVEDIKEAVTRVQPSAMREGFTTIPNVSWNDIGALEDIRSQLQTSILQPIRAPKLHRRFGLDHPAGVCLTGPPGNGKTLVAKAIAHESGANFISIKGPELLNKFVGESERSVRMVFARARASAPCVLFFDELDALAPRRGSDRANPSSERVVNQLLTEMDGVDGRENVFVIAATNRPDMIDPAMLRPGRLDKLLYVPLPNPLQRVSILKTIARKFPLHPDGVDLDAIGTSDELDGFSGADLASLVREASLLALKEVYAKNTQAAIDELERKAFDRKGKMLPEIASSLGIPEDKMPFVTLAHFWTAAKNIVPSVGPEERVKYEAMHDQFVKQKIK